ncbi:hypothetical protein KA005_04815 [bacterium]|nr:hypothetical protein [bacterium]
MIKFNKQDKKWEHLISSSITGVGDYLIEQHAHNDKNRYLVKSLNFEARYCEGTKNKIIESAKKYLPIDEKNPEFHFEGESDFHKIENEQMNKWKGY